MFYSVSILGNFEVFASSTAALKDAALQSSNLTTVEMVMDFLPTCSIETELALSPNISTWAPVLSIRACQSDQ